MHTAVLRANLLRGHEQVPVAGAYYWWMQQVLPSHAGSRQWDSPLHYLGPDTTASGSECAQFYLDTHDAGAPWRGLFPDLRAAPYGHTRNEPCGRAAITKDQNQAAFHTFPAPAWRLLDNDAFFVALPGFEHYNTPSWGLEPWGGGGWRYWNVPS